MNTKTLTFAAALIVTGCSSKFDENGRNPNGTGGDAAQEDSGAFDEMPNDDDNAEDNSEEPEPEPEPEPVDGDDDGYTAEEGDCDDDDDTTHPDADEICDGIDNNCNDRIDEAMEWFVWFEDNDADGYGNPLIETEACYQPDGFVDNNLDCDDSEENIHPNAEDIIGDEIDNDCDERVDEHFDTESFEDEGNMGSPSSVQADQFGQVHLLFHDADTGALLYRLKTSSGRWNDTLEIGREGVNGEYVDSVVDEAGILHIGYTEANDYTRGLMYIQRSVTGIWSDAIVIDGFEPGQIDIGQYVSIDVDSWGLPSFGYFDADEGEPMVADMTMLGVTLIIPADNNYMADVFGAGAGYTGLYTSIAIDNANNDHLVYFDPYASAGTAPEVQYSQFNLELDEIEYSETVDEVSGQYISLAMRHDDVPCVAYQTTEARDLRYGCLIDGEWTLEDVDTVGYVGAYASLGFNDRDEAYIAYYDESNTRLKLAVENKDVGWNVYEVDNDGDVGRNVSLDMGADGRAHMSYYSASDTSLRYAIGR
jgi:hypothetical protein